MRAKGIDLSHWQKTFEPKGNIDFIIQKVSEGLAKDALYNVLLPSVKTLERRGGYHYFRTEVDPIAQAEFFFNTQGGQGFKFLVVDYEGTGNVLDATGEANLAEFVEELTIYTNKPILLYTSPYTLRDSLIAYDDDWANVPLWIAHYKDGEPETWGNPWKFWQYTSEGDGTEYGVGSTHVDLNVFNGTVEELDAWLGIEPVDCCEELRKEFAKFTNALLTSGDLIDTNEFDIKANATEIEKLRNNGHGLAQEVCAIEASLTDEIAGLTADIGILRAREIAHTREHNEEIAELVTNLEDIANNQAEIYSEIERIDMDINGLAGGHTHWWQRLFGG